MRQTSDNNSAQRLICSFTFAACYANITMAHSATTHTLRYTFFFKISLSPGGFTMPSSTNTSPFQLSYNSSTHISATNPTAHATVLVVRNVSGDNFAQVHVTATTQHVSYSKSSHHIHQTTFPSRKSLTAPQAYLA